MPKIILRPKFNLSRVGTLLYLVTQAMLVCGLLYHIPLRHLGISMVMVVCIIILGVAYWLFHPRFVAMDNRTEWEKENYKLREQLNVLQGDHLLDRLLLMEYIEELAQRHPTTLYKHYDARKTRLVIDQGVRKLEFDWFTRGHRIFLLRLETYPTVTVVKNPDGLTEHIHEQD